MGPRLDARRVLLQRQRGVMGRFGFDFVVGQIDLELAL